MAKVKVLVCPYCGDAQPAAERCRACGGRFDPMSRRATHNEMGPWFVRSPDRTYLPGCSYERMLRLIELGEITRYSVVRGPTTRQLWTVAKRVPGLAHLLGTCHECGERVDPAETHCTHCGVAFGAYLDRDWLGLPEVRPLPGEPGEDVLGLAAPGPAASGRRLPAPMPMGLSSFASDAALYADDVAPLEAAEPGGPAKPSEAQILASPAVRALQRRLARQDRALRVLALLLVIAVLAGIVINLQALGRLKRNAPPAEEPAAEVAVEADGEAMTPPAGADAAGPAAPTGSEALPGGDDAAPDANDAGATEAEGAASEESADEATPTGAEAADDPELAAIDARLAAADALDGAARIDELAAVLAQLEALAASRDDDALRRRVGRLRDRVERERLRHEFFDPP